jgi:L-fuculose-phosphate aldolase
VKYEAERKAIVKACQDMNRRGINQGTSGNISVRVKEGFLLTPSGMAYDEMKPGDIVLMRPDASHTGKRKPSSEWRFHHALMGNRPEIGAVVHTHSMFATTLSCLGMEIPAVHYMVAAAGGENIRCAPYATYGTQETAGQRGQGAAGPQRLPARQPWHDRSRTDAKKSNVAGG